MSYICHLLRIKRSCEIERFRNFGRPDLPTWFMCHPMVQPDAASRSLAILHVLQELIGSTAVFGERKNARNSDLGCDLICARTGANANDNHITATISTLVV